MSHNINAFVSKRPALSALSRELDGAPFYRLKHTEFLILPVQYETFEAFTKRRGQSEAVVEGFWQLPANLAELGRECSVHGAIAYVVTDYFGGTGTQAGAAWRQGRIVSEPEVGKSSRVNSALHAIDLVDEPGLDAFDTLDLDDVRSMSDFGKLKPGQVLLGYFVEHAINEGNKVLDFLKGDHRYKDELATGVRETMYLTAFRARPGALVYRARSMVLPAIKAYLEKRLRRRPVAGEGGGVVD